MSARIDADVGGTFTDVLLQREDGSIALRKVLSTLPDYDRAVVARRMRSRAARRSPSRSMRRPA